MRTHYFTISQHDKICERSHGRYICGTAIYLDLMFLKLIENQTDDVCIVALPRHYTQIANFKELYIDAHTKIITQNISAIFT